MVFSSLIFLFAFLPIQLLAYYAAPAKLKNAVLLLFSIIFYCWSGPGYVLILASLSLISFATAKGIGGCGQTQDGIKLKKIYLFLEVASHLLVLIFFKYLSFGAQLINNVFDLWNGGHITVPAIVLPIGISFYTFQLISYVVDVYRGTVKANESYFKVLLYAGLFHQCIAGPIVRYETVADEIDNRKVSIDEIFSGLVRFSVGLAKKAILANACASVADALLPDSLEAISLQPLSALWIGAVFYTLHIYLDFSAYSDMAIGMGRMIGFHYLENFNYPYIAKSVTDFWRRWHISLSSFFRDYVYIPLGGNRVNAFRHILNLLFVWFLTGLWHGASANFVLWGLYYFVFLVIEKYVGKLIMPKDINAINPIVKCIGSLIYYVFTLLVIVVGWVIFRFDSFDSLVLVLKGMFGINRIELWNMNTSSLLLGNIYLLVVCIIVSTPAIKYLYRRIKSIDNKPCKTIINVVNILVPVVLIVLSAFALAGNSYNPFIYYRF